MKKIIVFEKLNLFTVLLAVFIGWRYKKKYFIGYGPVAKKYCSRIVKKLGLHQIHPISLPDHSILPKSSKKVIEVCDKYIDDNPVISKPLVMLLNDPRAESITKQIYVLGNWNEACKFTILTEFINKNKNEKVYYFSFNKRLMSLFLSNKFQNLIVLKRHFAIIALLDLFRSTIYLILLFLAPFLIFIKMLLCGEVVMRRDRSRTSKKIVFFHGLETLTQNESFKDRVMYFFNENILKYSECIHAGRHRPLLRDKADFLVKEGGIIYECHQHKVFIKSLFIRLFVDYFKSFLGSFHHLSFNKLSSFSVVRGFISTVYNTIKIESYLEGVKAKLVFFEVEYGVFPGLFTILANKNGTKTMSMVHGYAAYCYYDYTRSNMVLNYYLVPGNYYDRYLLRYNPHIDKCCSVGNHEIDNICIKGKGDIENIKQKGKKTVGIFIGFAAIYFPEWQRHPRQPLYDEALAKRVFVKDWMPFFEWAGRQGDILFVFKGKGGKKQYEHRYLKEALSKIPKENYYQNDDILMSNVISACDCLISSGNSSALFSSLCMGIPAICYDTFMKDYVAVEEYSDYLVARSPDELISKIRYLLENGLLDNVYESVLNDHYAEGRFDGKTSLRIKELITEVLQDSHMHSINGGL